MPRCFAVLPVAGPHFRIIPVGFNAQLEFLTGLTLPLVLLYIIIERKAGQGRFGVRLEY